MLGGTLRQHIVEFMPGYGVMTDGVIDATSLNGPWSWVVPSSAGDFSLSVINGGSGGGGGGDSSPAGTISVGGGAGGRSFGILEYQLFQPIAGSTLSVVCGAGGAGGAVGADGIPGGATYIQDAAMVDVYHRSCTSQSVSSGVQPAMGYIFSSGTPAASSTSASAAGGVSAFPYMMTSQNSMVYDFGRRGIWIALPGNPGGAGAASGATAGAGGSATTFDNQNSLFIPYGPSVAGNGATTGTISQGGGGGGAPSPLMVPYPPSAGTWSSGYTLFGLVAAGNGGATPGAPVMFGGGGGGGGGGAPGGVGAPGYARIRYWSAD